jgi:hypothetical protein
VEMEARPDWFLQVVLVIFVRWCSVEHHSRALPSSRSRSFGAAVCVNLPLDLEVADPVEEDEGVGCGVRRCCQRSGVDAPWC